MSNTETAAIIAAAHEKVTDTNKETRKRSLRDAAVSAVADKFGPFTITETVTLAKDAPKFAAWITGARGRNGFIITGTMGKAVVGETTLRDMIALGQVTNPEYLKDATTAPTMKGIIG